MATTTVSTFAPKVIGINSLVAFIDAWSKTHTNIDPLVRINAHVNNAVGGSIHSHFSPTSYMVMWDVGPNSWGKCHTAQIPHTISVAMTG